MVQPIFLVIFCKPQLYLVKKIYYDGKIVRTWDPSQYNMFSFWVIELKVQTDRIKETTSFIDRKCIVCIHTKHILSILHQNTNKGTENSYCIFRDCWTHQESTTFGIIGMWKNSNGFLILYIWFFTYFFFIIHLYSDFILCMEIWDVHWKRKSTNLISWSTAHYILCYAVIYLF